MKKLPGIVLFALVLAIPGWPRGPSPLPSVLRIGVYNNPPKIGISSSRQPYGFHIDVLDALLEGTGIKPEYVIGTWEENLGRLERGEIDMMPDVAYSSDRAKVFDFNNESVLLNWAVVYTAASEPLNTMADLDGKRVAVMKDSIHTIGEHGIISMASDFGIKCRFIYFDSYEETFTAIRQGRADAAVVNRLFGLMNENDDSLVRTAIVFNPSQLKYAFRKSAPANASLIELFDSRLVRLKEGKDSTYYKAFAKYLLPQISKERKSPEWLGNVVLLAIAIALIMTLFLLSARSGKSENMQLKRFFRENKSMGDIRVSIVDRALVSYSLFSIPLLLSILYHYIVVRWDPTIWLYIPTLVLPAVAAMLRKRLSALFKVGIILFFMFIMGVLVFISSGNVGIGFTYFLTAGIVTSLVYGKRAGLAALIAGLVITIGFGILVQDKVIQYGQEMTSYFISPSSWIFAVMSFSMMFFTIIGGIEKFYGNLIEAVEHLEQRIAERTKDIDTANKNLQIEILEHRKAEEKLEAARREAEQANSAKSTFFAGMSHEIRTPLNAILGYSQILLGDKSLSGESKREIETINSSGEHLLGLINQVLEMSKIEAGKTEVYVEPCNVSAVLRHVENMFAMTAGKKNIAFSVRAPADLPECIATDESKLKQILINLVGNAFKFTDSGSIELSVTRSVDDPGHLSFAVADTGSGIAPEDIDKIFQPFEQTDEGRSKGGTGLGLPISRKYCHLLGGDLLVESKTGAGSRFSFSIRADPCSPDSLFAKQEGDRIIGVKSGKLPRILVVDDRETNRDILLRMLQPLGFTVALASDGREALALTASWKPDLMLLDLIMPEMSGKDVIRIIRTDPARNDLKIIVITASALDGEKEGVLDLGANAFIRKPFREKEVLDEIGSLFGLEYLRQTDENAGTPHAAYSGDDLAKKLSSLPDDITTELRDSLKMGDIDRAAKIAGEISEYDADLAGAIQEMTENYQIGALLEMLRQIGETASTKSANSKK